MLSRLKYKKVIVVFLLFNILFVSSIIYIYIYKHREPFMFVDIIQISTREIYQKPKIIKEKYNFNFYINWDESFNKQIDKFLKVNIQDRNFYKDMIIVTKATQKLMLKGSKHSSDKLRILNSVFDISGKYRNVCSEAAKISTVFWQYLGYKSRVIWGGNHVVTEVYRDDLEKWVLVDSDGGVYAKNKNSFLNFIEVRKYSKLGQNIFVDIMTDKSTKKEKYNIDLYSRTKFFVLIDAKNIFNFHNKFRNPEYIIKYIFLDTDDEIKGLQSEEPNYEKLGNRELI